MLAVVENEQAVRRTENLDRRGQRRLFTVVADAERSRQRSRHQPRIGQRRQIDLPAPVGECLGVVLAEEEAEFSHLYTAHEKRVSEQITIAVRGMEANDLTDPGLGLIKRIILEKTNRALGKPLVREAIVSQFSFMER